MEPRDPGKRCAGMEYEMSDEERLFDESTNPSLLPGDETPRRPAKSQGGRADKRDPQMADAIREEEQRQA